MENTMILERFEVAGLAHYSYAVGSDGVIAIIDPKRDVDTYIRFADTKGVRIGYVLETHIHADYASGAKALAEATGAELCLSAYDDGEIFSYKFLHRELWDGDELELGSLSLRVLHTPGHTPEHISFLLIEPRRTATPVAMFSGDFLFSGSVGRPDLLGEGEKEKLARSLYQSVQKLNTLPDGMEVLPGHGAGSLCGAGISQKAQTTLGDERGSNAFLRDQSEGAFMDAVLSSVPEFPDYYRRMKELNTQGPATLERLPGANAFSAEQFRDECQRKGAVIVDLRRPEAFGGSHIPGAFNIGSGGNFPLWAGWILPYGKPIYLVGDEATNLEETRRMLIRVGHDDIRGSLRGGMKAWIEAGFEQAEVPQISVVELHKQMEGRPIVLDVRNPSEWSAGHIGGAIHIPNGDLESRLSEVPTNAPVHVICGSGYRSSIATSILLKHGLANVVNVNGGMNAWKARTFPTVKESQQQTLAA
jgi:hydroxyacylglutathione hydrolase